MFQLIAPLASSGLQNITTKLKDPELTHKVTSTAAWGWSTLSTQAGTLWSQASETVAGIAGGCVESATSSRTKSFADYYYRITPMGNTFLQGRAFREMQGLSAQLK